MKRAKEIKQELYKVRKETEGRGKGWQGKELWGREEQRKGSEMMGKRRKKERGKGYRWRR